MTLISWRRLILSDFGFSCFNPGFSVLEIERVLWYPDLESGIPVFKTTFKHNFEWCWTPVELVIKESRYFKTFWVFLQIKSKGKRLKGKIFSTILCEHKHFNAKQIHIKPVDYKGLKLKFRNSDLKQFGPKQLVLTETLRTLSLSLLAESYAVRRWNWLT